MASIIYAEIEKFNSKCFNGFQLNVERFCIWNEKVCVKEISIDDSGKIYRFTISFYESYKNFRKVGVEPTLTVDELTPGHIEGIYTVKQIYSANLGDVQPRKSVKVLQKFTKDYPETRMQEIVHGLKNSDPVKKEEKSCMAF